MITASTGGAVELYHNNIKKLSTGAVGVGTATTAGGTLIDGWITTTQANAVNNTTIATTAYVNNKIALIPAGLVFQGTWNAATNTPTLTSGSGTTGNFYIVSTPGNTNLDGITDWKTGDWAVFIEQGASDQWEKIDNSSVLDGFGTGGSVAGWAGSGTSNTLTNAPITFSGNNSTFANDINITRDILPVNTGASDLGTDAKRFGSLFTNGAFIGTLTSNNIQLQGDLKILNKAQTAYIGFATRNISGSETVMDITNAGSATFTGSATIRKSALGGSTPMSDGTLILGAGTTNYFSFRLDSGADLYLDKVYGGTAANVFSIDRSTTNGDITFAGTIETTKVRSDIMNNKADTANIIYRSGTDTIIGNNANALVVEDGGNVGVGTTSPDNRLDVVASDVNITPNAESSAVFRRNGNNYLTILSNASNEGGILFGNAVDDNDGSVSYRHNTQSMQFATADVERMRITSAGKVGIGLPDPSARLTVKGLGAVTGLSFATEDSSSNQTFFVQDGGRTGVRYYPLTVGQPSSVAAASNARFQIATTAGDFVVLNDGKTGIGTIIPEKKLHIKGTTSDSTPQVLVQNSSTGDASVLLNVSGQSYVFGIDYDDSKKFKIASSGNLGTTDRITLLSTGNVGIGTITPGAKLEVAGAGLFTGNATVGYGLGAVNTDGILTINSGSSSNGEAYLNLTRGGTSGFILNHAASNIQIRGTANIPMYIYTNGSIRQTITADGNVGIGTTSPQSKLQVAGGIQMADDTATASASKVGTMRYRTGTEYVDVTGTNLISNPDFTTDTVWTKETGWTITGGELVATAAAGNTACYQGPGLTNGSIYRCTFTISEYTSGKVSFRAGTAAANTFF